MTNFNFHSLVKTGNDEFYTPPYAVAPILPYIPKGKVWCPFDTNESNFVRMIASDHEVINTHIDFGQDFFNTDVPDGVNSIVSNPPYSLKTEVLLRLFNLGLPFAMLLGVVGLFESKKRVNMFRKNEFEVMYLSTRVAYMTDYSSGKCDKQPPFQSVYLCHKMLPKPFVFSDMDKKRQYTNLEVTDHD